MRALVVFHGKENGNGVGVVSPGIYLHHDGKHVPELLAKVRDHMEARRRFYDVEYTAARFVAICAEHIPGVLSLGIQNVPEELRPADISSMIEARLFWVSCPSGAIQEYRDGKIVARSGIGRRGGHFDTADAIGNGLNNPGRVTVL